MGSDRLREVVAHGDSTLLVVFANSVNFVHAYQRK